MYVQKYQKYTGIAIEVGAYLRSQPYIKKLFDDSVYTYNRKDNPNVGLPAIFVYFDKISPSGTLGMFSTGTLRVEIVRNTSIDNRGDIYNFSMGLCETIYQDLVMNVVFRRQLISMFPYIGMFGEKSQMDIVDSRNSTVISIGVFTSQTAYQIYLQGIPYNTTSEEEVGLIEIKEVAVL